MFVRNSLFGNGRLDLLPVMLVLHRLDKVPVFVVVGWNGFLEAILLRFQSRSSSSKSKGMGLARAYRKRQKNKVEFWVCFAVVALVARWSWNGKCVIFHLQKLWGTQSRSTYHRKKRQNLVFFRERAHLQFTLFAADLRCFIFFRYQIVIETARNRGNLVWGIKAHTVHQTFLALLLLLS